MARVQRTQTAERSLDEIFDYVGRKNRTPAAAARLLRRIAGKCELYATQPLMGEARQDLGPEVRCFPVDNFIVFYQPLEDGILVLVVLHGARDIPRFFRDLFGDRV
jgi:toxin ParE1/3/4